MRCHLAFLFLLLWATTNASKRRFLEMRAAMARMQREMQDAFGSNFGRMNSQMDFGPGFPFGDSSPFQGFPFDSDSDPFDSNPFQYEYSSFVSVCSMYTLLGSLQRRKTR